MVDVARQARVAVSTVSYAINGTRPISEETRQRIFAAMEELGYKPNAMARGLASKRSRIIALLFPAPERGLGITELAFVTSAVDAASENGYHLVLWTSEMQDANELRKLIQQGLVDGVVVMEIHMQDWRIDLLREANFPFSMIGRCSDNSGISYIDIDFEQTTRDAIQYLKELGHTHIAFLNHSQAEYDAGYGPAVRALDGFYKAAREADIYGIAKNCLASPQTGYDIFQEIMAECPELTALISMNERTIPGVMSAIHERKWRVPEDFSLVVIVSSAGVAQITMPPLTTMDGPCTELGRLGVELLIQRLEGQDAEPVSLLMPSQLVVRGSSGRCLRQAGTKAK